MRGMLLLGHSPRSRCKPVPGYIPALHTYQSNARTIPGRFEEEAGYGWLSRYRSGRPLLAHRLVHIRRQSDCLAVEVVQWRPLEHNGPSALPHLGPGPLGIVILGANVACVVHGVRAAVSELIACVRSSSLQALVRAQPGWGRLLM